MYRLGGAFFLVLVLSAFWLLVFVQLSVGRLVGLRCKNATGKSSRHFSPMGPEKAALLV